MGCSYGMGSLVHSHNLSAEVPKIGPAEGSSGFRACEEDGVMMQRIGEVKAGDCMTSGSVP
jgi:hypothetical protein